MCHKLERILSMIPSPYINRKIEPTDENEQGSEYSLSARPPSWRLPLTVPKAVAKSLAVLKDKVFHYLGLLPCDEENKKTIRDLANNV